MERRTKIIVSTVAAVGILGAAGTGMAVAGGVGDDDGGDTPITGTALDQASAAALEHTGGGKVTGTEVNDEQSYYEVEVTLDNGNQVDVQLDKNFKFVGEDNDGKGEDEGSGSDD